HLVDGPQDVGILGAADEMVDGVVASGIDVTIEKSAVVERRVTTDDGERVALDTLVRALRP
ncbi:MAG: class I SAM-dependent methyltransferase, partial [Acidimicrobiia bacterium]